jgi:hypothetical protein
LEWDLSFPGPDVVDDAVMSLSGTGGFPAPPGQYRVRLSTGEWSVEQSFEVRKDPRADVTQEDLQAQFELAKQVRDRLTEVHDAIRKIRSTRSQLSDVIDRAEAADVEGDVSSIQSTAEQIQEQLTSIEEQLVQTKNESRQDPINFPPKLDNQLAYLYTHINGFYGRPTEGTYERFDDLEDEIEAPLSRLSEILNSDVSELNRFLAKQDVLHVTPSSK